MAEQRDSVSPKASVFASYDFDDERMKAEIGARLQQAVKLAGGNKAVAAKSGVPLRTLGHLLEGQEPKACQLVRIAGGCGVSVDWLATGRLPVHPVEIVTTNYDRLVEEALLRDVLEVVEEFLAERKLALPPDKKAGVVAVLCAMAAKDGKEVAELAPTLSSLVKLAS